MKVTIDPGFVNGVINAPPSKSYTQRIYAAALLHTGRTIIHNTGSSDDEEAALAIVQQLGARLISSSTSTKIIESNGLSPITDTISCGESGLSARLFIPIASICNKPLSFTGSGSLLGRSMKQFDELLPRLGVSITGNKGHLPLSIQGPFSPDRDIVIDGSESSQYISGLLFALCYWQQAPLYKIKVRSLASKPYVDMTMQVLRMFGNNAQELNDGEYEVSNNEIKNTCSEIKVNVSGDWSGAAFWLVAGAIAGEIIVTGLEKNEIQADSAIYDVLKTAGAFIEWVDDTLQVKKSNLQGFEFDATHCPDLFPVLAILAACCRGESYISGVHRLFNKESNRAESIGELLENFNVPYSIESDAFCITGVKVLQGTVIDPHHDHRIVMAAAIGALRANGPVDIIDAESVNKSYPAFFSDLARVTTNVSK